MDSDAYHSAICDQSNQGILGEQAQAHDDGVLESLQAILLLAGIHDEQENRGRGSGPVEAVLDGSAAWVELRGDGFLGDVLVVGWERVPGQAEGAYPLPRAHINLTGEKLVADRTSMHIGGIPEGIENGAAWRLAGHGLILEQRGLGPLLQRRVQRGNRDYSR